MPPTESCLYVGPDLATAAVVTEKGLTDTTERHRFPLQVPALTLNQDPLSELNRRPDFHGVIMGMERGWPGSSHLRFAARVLARGRRVWLYWPDEEAIECLDAERIRSYWRHWALITTFRLKRRLGGVFGRREGEPDRGIELADRCSGALRKLAEEAHPVPFEGIADPNGTPHINGLGVYLRTDYWVALTSGGSYGHTCYVAKELAAVTDRFMCLMANPYPMLDEFGLQQVAMRRASESTAEVALLSGTWHYYPILKVAFEALRPSYIYERLCLGNFAGALLSRELGIPLIVEYNGSEISMSRSFDGTRYFHEDLFVRAEDAAFRQATMITVVSQVIKDSLVARGVNGDKILVNPNGADPSAYAPADADVRTALRTELGFAAADRVIGFAGTFGGWHGIDVLAAAIAPICQQAPNAKFLLIGDGSHKPTLDEAVARNGLDARVKRVGRVPQHEGARLLKACDLYVSPHNSHMIDSRFFGSPTKLFEYMAMGRGIVASDLEQIGQVLSPALRAADFARGAITVGAERAVLCKPGDVDEFVAAVVALVERGEVADALGRNAREAVLTRYSWQQHVRRIWSFAQKTGAPGVTAETRPTLVRVKTGDRDKDEVQTQWDNNPVGSQYARSTQPHTLAWFLEIETHRYGQYAPWMPGLMEFERHAGHDLLEIGGGVGTDLAQFARHGARVTDLDLSAGHLEHARENFALRGLQGRFIHDDAERMPFEDNSFDVVYSNGVLHHTPNTAAVVREIRRVLRPGGKAIVMMYAENSLHYWWQLVWKLGLQRNLLTKYSIGEILSRYVEVTNNDAKPLVKVYTASRLKQLFAGFMGPQVYQRQLMGSELPPMLKSVPLETAGKVLGWNLIIKARKPGV